MRRRGRRLGILKVTAFISVTLGILLIGELTQAMAESWLAGEENAMTSHVNSHRHQKGLPSLTTNAGLKMIARRQAQRMVMKSKIYHNPNLMDEADRAIPDWILLGENVGVGPSEPEVEQAFLDSPAHRSNIEERDYNILGVGAMAADDGQMYFTQNFAEIKSKAKTAPKKKATAPKKTAPKPVVKPKRRTPPILEVKGNHVTKPAKPSVAPKPSKSPQPKATPTVLRSPSPKPAPAAPANKQQSEPGLLNSIGVLLGEAFRKIGTALSKLAFWK